MLLLQRVRDSADDAEYEMLRQQWDTVNRTQYAPRTWSPKQEEVLGAVAYAVSLDDEEDKRQGESKRRPQPEDQLHAQLARVTVKKPLA